MQAFNAVKALGLKEEAKGEAKEEEPSDLRGVWAEGEEGKEDDKEQELLALKFDLMGLTSRLAFVLE